MSLQALSVCVRRRRWIGYSSCRHQTCLTSSPAPASACVRECMRVRAQFRHDRRWRIKHRDQQVSEFPHCGEASPYCFAPGVNVVACAEWVRRRRWVGPSRCRRHARLTAASAPACARTYVPLFGRAQLRHGWRWPLEHGDGNVSPLIAASITANHVEFSFARVECRRAKCGWVGYSRCRKLF